MTPDPAVSRVKAPRAKPPVKALDVAPCQNVGCLSFKPGPEHWDTYSRRNKERTMRMPIPHVRVQPEENAFRVQD